MLQTAVLLRPLAVAQWFFITVAAQATQFYLLSILSADTELFLASEENSGARYSEDASFTDN